MKRFFALLAVVAIAIASVFSGVLSFGITASAATEKLVIYNWADYIFPDLIDEFEEYYAEKYGVGLEVEYNTFETNEEIITKVLLGDLPIDLICPSEYAIEKLIRNKAIKQLDLNKIENYGNIDPAITEKIYSVFGDIEVDGEAYNMSDYMVPYMWGTLGILYNADIVTEEDLASGWGLLWNKAGNPDLDGKILVKDSVRDTYVAAVLYAKEEGLLPEIYDELSVQDLINTIDDELLSIAEDVLIAQQKVLKGYEVDFGKDDMIKESAYLDLAWSGDALYAIELAYEEDINLDYLVPEIGSNLWFDGWVMAATSKNERAAMEFINYLCSSESAIQNMMEIGYTSAVSKDILMEDEFVAETLLENEYDFDEYFSDPIRYPEITDNLGVMKDFGDKNEAAIMMWENIKPGSTVPLLVILAILVGAAGIVILTYILLDKYKGKYRRIS